jgi:hypothetical protein
MQMRRKTVGVSAWNRRANAYFSDPQNRPFSMQEVCLALGVDYKTLCGWETGPDEKLATLARQVRARVAAGWEKGEVSASLAALMLKTYGEPDAGGQAQADAVENLVRVVGDDC